MVRILLCSQLPIPIYMNWPITLTMCALLTYSTLVELGVLQ